MLYNSVTWRTWVPWKRKYSVATLGTVMGRFCTIGQRYGCVHRGFIFIICLVIFRFKLKVNLEQWCNLRLIKSNKVDFIASTFQMQILHTYIHTYKHTYIHTYIHHIPCENLYTDLILTVCFWDSLLTLTMLRVSSGNGLVCKLTTNHHLHQR